MQAHTDNVNFEWTPERHTIYQEIVDRHGGPYNMTAGMVLDEMGPAIVKAHGFKDKVGSYLDRDRKGKLVAARERYDAQRNARLNPAAAAEANAEAAAEANTEAAAETARAAPSRAPGNPEARVAPPGAGNPEARVAPPGACLLYTSPSPRDS